MFNKILFLKKGVFVYLRVRFEDCIRGDFNVFYSLINYLGILQHITF